MTLQRTSSIQSAPPSGRNRPFGLKALIALLLIQGLLSIAVVIALFVTDLPIFNTQTASPDDQVVNLISYVILGAARFIIAVGLWRLHRWAWLWMMLQLAGSMAIDIQTYYAGQPLYASMILNVIVVFYLNQHEVQALFATAKEVEAP
ncbi:MAG: hypothetical protein KDE31_20540 [Caldilineaceae bacterium]|nr:hypothetical protein [Caldilineaceae bacterium]